MHTEKGKIEPYESKMVIFKVLKKQADSKMGLFLDKIRPFLMKIT